MEKFCEIKDCNKSQKARNLCDMHYARWLRTGTLVTKQVERGSISVCIVPECNLPHCAHGLCKMHYKRLNDNNSPFTPKIIKTCGWFNCDKPHSAKGLCSTHYSKWQIILESHSLDSNMRYQ